MFDARRTALCVLVLFSASGCRRRAPRSSYAAAPVSTAPIPPPPPMPRPEPVYATQAIPQPPPMPRPDPVYATQPLPPPAPPPMARREPAPPPVPPRRGQMIFVTYGPAAPAHRSLEAWLTRQRPLDAPAEMVENLVALRRPLSWRVEECDNLAFWSPKTASLVVCYRYFEFLQREVRAEDINAVTLFTVLHEVAHSLASEFSLPIVGGDEKAADLFAATVLLRNVRQTNQLLPTIRFFHQLSTKYKTTPWDEHPSDGQRYYDLLCLSWGAGAAHADDLAALLPEERRVRCKGEYVNAWTGWHQLLTPHSRVRGGETFWPL